MTINILSRTVFNSLFGPDTWRFEISSGDAANILTNPNALNVNISGFGLKNINNPVYGNSITPPYPTLWTVTQISSVWYVTLSRTGGASAQYFTNINNWLNFDGPYNPLTPASPHTISITQYPQDLMPVYNPITFKFYSPLYSEPGYRYLVNVKSNGTDIGSYKLVPSPDGSGYIDISSLLSNYTTYDFSQGIKLLMVINSIVILVIILNLVRNMLIDGITVILLDILNQVYTINMPY